MIAVPTGEYARRADFYDYLGVIEREIGWIDTRVHGQSPARNRNIAIQQAIDNNCTHVMFFDDDVCPPPNIVKKLLKHNVSIVSGLYLMRAYPHQPIIFDYADYDGRCLHHFLSSNESGLIEVVSCGLGCLLIKIDVFKNMEKPWIRLGEIESDHWCDDTGFTKRARAVGYKIHCDLDILVGHQVSMTIWPTFNGERWFTTYDTKGSGSASVPQLCREKERETQNA